MSLIGCVGSRVSDAVLEAIENAIKYDEPEKLQAVLTDYVVGTEEVNRKHFLHKAAWLGYPRCVAVLLHHGANPNWPHRKNGCTALHLAHLWTVEDTNPVKTIQELVLAGANVNSRGSRKCGKGALDHAIQHQKFDSVAALVEAKSVITLQSVVTAIDVSNPQILELLLVSGGKCGSLLESTLFWGKALHRVIYSPLKLPKECYKSMFKLLTEATVCLPIMLFTAQEEEDSGPWKMKAKQHLIIENELKIMANEYVELAQYLYMFMVRNGYIPNDSVKAYMSSLGEIDWIDEYLSKPVTLKDLAVRVVRSTTNQSGNILFAMRELNLPNRLNDLILFRC